MGWVQHLEIKALGLFWINMRSKFHTLDVEIFLWALDVCPHCRGMGLSAHRSRNFGSWHRNWSNLKGLTKSAQAADCRREGLLPILCPTGYWTSILLPALFWWCSAQWQSSGDKSHYRTVFEFSPRWCTKIPYEMSKKGNSCASLPYWRALSFIPAQSRTCLFQSWWVSMGFLGIWLLPLASSEPTCVLLPSSSYYSMWDFS